MDKKKNTTLMVVLIAVGMVLVAAVVIGLGFYAGWKSVDRNTDKTAGGAATPTAVKEREIPDEDGVVADYEQAGYLTLGKYKGIEVDTEPTADDVLEEMESNLEKMKMTEKHKGRIKEGDFICIDYKGYIDGEEDEDFSGEAVVLCVGEYAYEKSFEEALVGKQPGDKVSVSVTYDDSYEELSGETVDFKITVRGRFDDYYANKFSNGKYPTVEKYVANVTATLKKQNGTPKIAGGTAWDTVMENCNVSKYPEGAVEKQTAEEKQQYEDVAEMQGVTLEEMLAAFGMDEDSLAELAEDTLKERMVAKTIAAKEILVMDDESYEKYLLESMEMKKEDGVTLEELEKTYLDEYGSHPKDDMLILFIQEYIGKEAKLR